MVWTDGSRLEDKRVGAAFVWRSASKWSGRRFHLGTNKEVFDAEVFAIYQALLWIEVHQATGGRFTVFADSTAAIEWVRADALGPGQRFAVAAIEVCNRILTGGNQVTIRWVPYHIGIEGSEMADRYAKAANDRSAPCRDEATPRELIDEATLSHMTRGQVPGHGGVDQGQRSRGAPLRLLPGRSLRRQHLRNTRKGLAGRSYQFLSGHANIEPYLHRVGTIDDDRFWYCNTGEQQTCFHLVARCPAWRG